MKPNYHAGLAAEDTVIKAYQNRGHEICGTRWRGSAGEIDVIADGVDGLVFIEVKRSKTFAQASLRVSPRQQSRIYNTACEFLGTTGRSMDTQARFDVALVDGTGQVRILENAFGQV